jgi:hypothetical protein
MEINLEWPCAPCARCDASRCHSTIRVDRAPRTVLVPMDTDEVEGYLKITRFPHAGELGEPAFCGESCGPAPNRARASRNSDMVESLYPPSSRELAEKAPDARARHREGFSGVQQAGLRRRGAAGKDQAADRRRGRPCHAVTLLHPGAHQSGPSPWRHGRRADGSHLGRRRDAGGRRLRALRDRADRDRRNRTTGQGYMTPWAQSGQKGRVRCAAELLIFPPYRVRRGKSSRHQFSRQAHGCSRV